MLKKIFLALQYILLNYNQSVAQRFSVSSGMVTACSLGTWGQCAHKKLLHSLNMSGTWGNAFTQLTHAAVLPHLSPGCLLCGVVCITNSILGILSSTLDVLASLQTSTNHSHFQLMLVACAMCLLYLVHTATTYIKAQKYNRTQKYNHTTVSKVVLLNGSATVDRDWTSLQRHNTSVCPDLKSLHNSGSATPCTVHRACVRQDCMNASHTQHTEYHISSSAY
jgi:hypothetical protein